MDTITLGEFRISRVVESEGATPVGFLLPGITEDMLATHEKWLAPHFYDPASGDLVMSIHSFIVKTPRHTILIDTCVGNDKKRPVPNWNMRQGSYLEDIRAGGIEPEEVDFVMCTHLHVDHVGWNTRLENERWVPTFPNARYLFARGEWDFWKQGREESHQEIMRDSLLPVMEAGQADLVETNHMIGDGVGFESTPGHTPGHVSLHLESAGREAVITGDMMHHPIQCGEPDVSSSFCVDPLQAATTRKSFLARYADGPVRILGTHFAAPTAGRIVSAGESSWRFEI